MSESTECLADAFKIAYPLTYDEIYQRGRKDAIDEYTCKDDCEYGYGCEGCIRWKKLADCYEPPKGEEE